MGFVLGVILLVGDFHFDLDRIARVNRGRVTNFVVPVRHDVRVRLFRLEDQTRAYAECQVTVCNPVLDRLRFGEFLIRVVGLPVTGMHGMHHDIRFGNGPGVGHVRLADFEVLEELCFLRHVISFLL